MKNHQRLDIVIKSIDPETPIMEQRIRPARKDRAGRKTKLTQSVWFATVFELNELNAMRGIYEKVLNDKQILHNWEIEFRVEGSKRGNGLASGTLTVGMFRERYRQGVLYKQQLRPILYSFRYTRDKEPRHDKRVLEMMTLDECREKCLQAKIADPRFFNIKELAKIRNHAKREGRIHEWSIPSPHQYETLNDSVVGGVYGAYKLYDNPYNDEWSPPEDD